MGTRVPAIRGEPTNTSCYSGEFQSQGLAVAERRDSRSLGRSEM
jgi:hypothetical protein